MQGTTNGGNNAINPNGALQNVAINQHVNEGNNVNGGDNAINPNGALQNVANQHVNEGNNDEGRLLQMLEIMVANALKKEKGEEKNPHFQHGANFECHFFSAKIRQRGTNAGQKKGIWRGNDRGGGGAGRRGRGGGNMHINFYNN